VLLVPNSYFPDRTQAPPGIISHHRLSGELIVTGKSRRGSSGQCPPKTPLWLSPMPGVPKALAGTCRTSQQESAVNDQAPSNDVRQEHQSESAKDQEGEEQSEATGPAAQRPPSRNHWAPGSQAGPSTKTATTSHITPPSSYARRHRLGPRHWPGAISVSIAAGFNCVVHDAWVFIYLLLVIFAL
jgi:hypothetical protein